MIQRLEEKNINTDGKDVIIANLHSFIRKIESAGYELLKRLRQGELKLKTAKQNSFKEESDKAFMQNSLKQAKLKCRT